MAQKIWLITGISSGLGKTLAEEVIAAGDFVIGTFRKAEQVEAFNKHYPQKAAAIQMDVNKPEQITAGVAKALALKGQIDVLVNNAGYGLFGAVEEASDAEVRAQLETNVFGALAVTRAVLPAMRKAKKGHIVQISSVAGFRAMPGLGIYNASKFALEGLSEALAQEIAPLGIKLTLIQPGPFRTEWAGSGSKDAAQKIADYKDTAHKTAEMVHSYSGNQPGDPVKAAKAIITVVNAEHPPLRLPLGQMAIDRIRDKLATLTKELDQWQKLSINTSFDV